MKNRGFTLIELGISMSIVMLVLTSICQMVLAYSSEFRQSEILVDVRTEARAAAWKVQGRAASGDFRISDNNHGIIFSGRSRLEWKDEELLLDGRKLVNYPVKDFCVVNREGHHRVTLVLEYSGPKGKHLYRHGWQL